ncbi:hypothetical protein CHLRE_04g212600v5 [Chlamydomonas reinhardtii]|uniref:Uncharacterized protein n=1 Tax=Chlamydomonas reinhardtii TaxID=3055 RepID=A8J9V1_CHLRE|nr:uncharacterized protein CHLRE_04g212600v5 [Chlamydomonas reinhardtii]PNW83993.1 hypothetical protein CHLRE_04g212600v5 [Chlamydomonas reinhardtii]|eukprot:XP_001698679.1 predicted protein [Chlamydomonas reinhardtii]
MDRVMVRVSSGKGTVGSRFSPARSYSVSAAPQPTSPFSFQGFMYLLLALCGVFLVAHFVFTASESSRALRSSLRSVPAEAILHAQLVDKEKEIEKLRWEIDQIRKGVTMKDSSINKQEDVIQELKSKAQSEHQAKTKAELALTERAGALSECIEQKMALAGEVAQCHFDLKSLLSGENHGAMSRASADALGKMSKMSREQELRSGEEEQHRAAASGLGSGNFGTA